MLRGWNANELVVLVLRFPSAQRRDYGPTRVRLLNCVFFFANFKSLCRRLKTIRNTLNFKCTQISCSCIRFCCSLSFHQTSVVSHNPIAASWVHHHSQSLNNIAIMRNGRQFKSAKWNEISLILYSWSALDSVFRDIFHPVSVSDDNFVEQSALIWLNFAAKCFWRVGVWVKPCSRGTRQGGQVNLSTCFNSIRHGWQSPAGAVPWRGLQSLKVVEENEMKWIKQEKIRLN